jgi:hypothetical protein
MDVYVLALAPVGTEGHSSGYEDEDQAEGPAGHWTPIIVGICGHVLDVFRGALRLLFCHAHRLRDRALGLAPARRPMRERKKERKPDGGWQSGWNYSQNGHELGPEQKRKRVKGWNPMTCFYHVACEHW